MSLELPPNQLGTAGLTTNPASATQDMDGYKITDLATPTADSDAVTKAYADSLIQSGGASTWSQYPATQNVDIDGFSINDVASVNATNVNALNDVVAAGTVSLVTTASQTATNTANITSLTTSVAANTSAIAGLETSVANKANLTGADNTFTNSQQFNGDNFLVGSSGTPIADTFEIHAQDVNLRAHGTTDILNITSFAGTVIAAGGALNMTGGLSSSLYSAAGTVGVGGVVNHIIVDGNNVEDVANLTASGDVSCANVVASGDVGCATVTCSDTVDTNILTVGGGGTILGGLLTDTLQVAAITATSVVNLSGATSVTVPTPTANNQATTKLYVDNAISGAANVSQWATFPAVAPVAVPTEVALQQPLNTSLTMSMSDGGTVSANFVAPVPVPFVGESITVSFPNQFMYIYNDIPVGVDLPSFATIGIPPGTYNPTTYLAALNSALVAGIAQAYTITSQPVWLNLKIVASMSPTYILTYTCFNTISDKIALWSQDYPISPPSPSGQASAPLFGLQWNTTPVYFGEVPEYVAMQYTREGVAGAWETMLTTQSNPPTLTYTSGTKTIGLIANDWDGEPVTLSQVSIASALADYVPLAGTEAGAPVTGTIAFEDGNGNIECADIATALISAVAPYDFISVTSPMQTRLLGVRSEDGTAPATIAMALSETAEPPAVLTMTYNPNGNDKLEVNKGMILDGGLVMGAGGGVNNIENVLGLYSSEIVESKTLQAIDINSIGDGSITYKTTDPLFADENGTVMSVTYPDPTAQNTVLYARGALSLVDPPNGGLPAQILINNVPQTLNGSDWSSYAATQNVDMASFDIDNAGAIGATSLATSDFITSDTTITGLDVVATNSLSVDGLDVKATLDFVATNELYVATNGSDSTGNGSIQQPFFSIQKAVDTANLVTPKTGVTVINIANGTYNLPIFITGANSGYIQLNGQSTSQNQTFGVVINAGIFIQMNDGADDLISRQVILSGLQLNSVISNTSSKQHTVSIQNCRFYPSADVNGMSIQDFNTATSNRCLVDNCEYTNDYPSATPQPCFNFTGNTTVSFSKCDIQSPNDADIFSIGGGSYLQRLENCYIESQFVNPTAALVDIISTSPNFHSIALNVFAFRDSTSTTAPAIITQNGGTLLVASNIFDLTGTNPSTGNVIQYSGTAPTLIYGNNSAVPLYASGVQSGITLVPLAGVGSNPIRATTVTASGAITGGSLSAGSGTISGGAISGTTVTTTGAIKSSGTLQLSGNAITNASNNTTITGLNGITMAGTTPSITGVNSLAISNTNATTPLTITNSGDNPSVIVNNAGASTTIPVEINLVNGSTTLAYGNQGADPRGAFFFFNGRDCIRIPSGTGRVQMTYSPYSPTLATSGTAGAWVAGTGSFVSGVPKLLGTETITLGVNNLPIIAGGLGVQCYLGLNGYLNTCVLNASHEFLITATYTRTRSGVTTTPLPLYGCSYPTATLANGSFFSPLNGTTYDEATPANRTTFTHGDILAIQVYGTYTGGSPPTIVTPATGLAAVFSPFFI
jgi:hypothetical protein